MIDNLYFAVKRPGSPSPKPPDPAGPHFASSPLQQGVLRSLSFLFLIPSFNSLPRPTPISFSSRVLLGVGREGGPGRIYRCRQSRWRHGRNRFFDATGRLWIATQRDHNEFSYLDVFSARDGAFIGSVKVRDHMKGFDLVGSTLVVLVERVAGPDDSGVVPDNAINWYETGGVGLALISLYSMTFPETYLNSP